ncbi:DUF354 domain-containing protein [Candidatus Bathyarchaeota archaeon]|nr:DUF354 domain-containing protein [Candidatus Bathyarchaeota archaeon]
MRILVKMGHPADVHFFKHFVWNMDTRGHQVLICAADKDVTLRLLDAYGFRYIRTGESQENLIAKIAGLGKEDYRLWQVARKFRPDILTGLGSISAAHVSALLRKPCITFEDTEHSREQYYLYAPFTSVICSPSCFNRDLGKKQVRYNGYHQLAYLHPNYFKPDPSVLDELGLTGSDRFIIVRFVAWQATHDIGQHGFDLQTKRKLVEELEKYARVFITSESSLPEDFERYRITTSPEKMLDLLFYATMYIGEGSTMAIEAAVLGTPSLYVSSLSKTLGHCAELEERYDLLYRYQEPERALSKATELLQQPDIKEQWAKKQQRFLADKIDVTKFMIDFIENYPESFYRYRERRRGDHQD